MRTRITLKTIARLDSSRLTGKRRMVAYLAIALTTLLSYPAALAILGQAYSAGDTPTVSHHIFRNRPFARPSPNPDLGDLPDEIPILRHRHILRSGWHLGRNDRATPPGKTHRSGRSPEMALLPMRIRGNHKRAAIQTGKPEVTICPTGPGEPCQSGSLRCTLPRGNWRKFPGVPIPGLAGRTRQEWSRFR